jgi:hypothetical protein
MLLKNLVLSLAFAGAVLVPLMYGAPAHAQATRTWVSGVGDDANPCSRTAPCKTWAGAISKTQNGGEIDALDPGGFGALTITKSITLDGGGGQVASTLVAGTNGFNVSAGATDVVTIRNLRIDGLLGNGSNAANAGLTGISFVSGAVLTVEDCWIFGFNTAGIGVSTSGNSALNISNTRITNTPNGINLAPSAGSLLATADHVTIQDTSSNAINASGAGSVILTVTNSVLAGNNNNGNGVNAAGSTFTRVNVDGSSITNFATGVNVASANSYIRLSNNTIYFNNNTYLIAAGGNLGSAGNNRVIVSGAAVPNATVTQQ